MNKKYLIIMLILYSEENQIYKYNKHVWEKYMNTNKNILALFIKYDEQMENEVCFIESENMLLIKGAEKYSGEAIYLKTLKAIKFCDENFEYKFILRTNISSFWLLNNLEKFANNINTTNVLFGGFSKTYFKNRKTLFVSGTSIFLSKNLVNMLLTHTNVAYPDFLDDFEIYKFYKNNNVAKVLYNSENFVQKFEYSDKEIIIKKLKEIVTDPLFFRVKNTPDRYTNDKIVMDYLLKKYYNVCI